MKIDWLELWKGLWRGLISEHGKPLGVDNPISITRTLPSGYDRENEESVQRHAIVAFLKANVGDPYTFGAEIDVKELNPSTGDCSEYMEQAYIRAGLAYPDGAANQRNFCRGRAVMEPKLGDPFFLGPNTAGIPHTGAYVGDGMVVHAAGRPIGRVVMVSLAEIKSHPRFQGWFRHPEFLWEMNERV